MITARRNSPKRFRIRDLVVAAITLIGGVTMVSHASGQPASTAPQSTVSYSASWAKGYTSVVALDKDADIAVDGTIARVIAVSRESSGIVFTDYGLSVDSVAFNAHKSRVASEIVIHQTGGILDYTRYEFPDNPLFQIGEHVVLFLQEYNAGHYFVIGGPTGRFRIQNGLVQSTSQDGVKFNGQVSEAEFLDSIRKAAPPVV